MDYLDFELAIGAGDGHTYPVSVVRSPAGEQRASTQFPFDELELKNQLQALQIALLKSGSTRRDVVQPQEKASIEDFGKALFSTLFPEEVRSCYRLSRQMAMQEGKGLRLRLRIEAPELAALPWEYLYDESEGDFICLSTETPIVRYLELDRPPEPLTFTPPMRILGMVASPDDRPKLDVEREKQRIAEALSDLESRGLVSMTWMEGATWQDLQRAMRQGPWHVFHFVGHGGFDATAGEGMLALCDENNQTFRLTAVKLGRLLADHRDLRLVVLNACEGAQGSDNDIFSSTASVLIRRGVPAVIAMQFEITDRAAIEFVHVFMEVLAEGLPVDAAVSEARKAISLSVANTVEWGTPVLHMRSPDGRLFDFDADAPPTKTPAYAKHVSPETERPKEAPDEAEEPVEAANAEAGITQTRSTSPLTVLFSGRRKRFVIPVGVAALFVVILGALLISKRDTGAVHFTSLEQIASIALFADAGDVLQGASVPMRIVVMDSTGRKIRTEDMSDYPLVWDPGDSTIARVVPSEFGYSARVEVLRPGQALICVGFADTSNTVRRFVAKYLINVLPEEGGQADVYREYIAALREFNDPDISDEAVLATYERILRDHRANLRGVLEPEDLTVFDDRVQKLRSLTALYAEVEGEDQSNTLSIVDERAQWEAVLAQADTVRKSAAKTRAASIVDSLRTIEAEYATVVSLYLCSTGGLDCPERSRVETFAQGQRVFFSATVAQPSSGTIRWEWRGPDGSTVGEGSDSLPASSSGYRTYKYFDAESTGGYELRVYNSQEHLIGRRTFVVEPGGTGAN